MGQCSFLPIALTWASSDYKDIVPGNCNITADTMDIRSGGSMSQSPTEVMEKVSLSLLDDSRKPYWLSRALKGKAIS